MFVTDKSILGIRKRLVIPATQFHSGSDGGLTMTALPSYPQLRGIKLTTTGGFVDIAVPLPNDINPDRPIGCRIHAISYDSSLLTGALFRAILTFQPPWNGTTGGDFYNGVELDVPIGNLTITTSSNERLLITSRGIKNSIGLTRQQIRYGTWLDVSLELSSVSGTINSTSAIWCMGFELDYCPMRTRLPHNEIDWPVDEVSL